MDEMERHDKTPSTRSTCSTASDSDGLHDPHLHERRSPACSDDEDEEVAAPLFVPVRQRDAADTFPRSTHISVFFVDTFLPNPVGRVPRYMRRRQYTFVFKVGDSAIFEFTASFEVMRRHFKPIWPDFPSKHIFQDYTWNESNAEFRGDELECYFEKNLNLRSKGAELCSLDVIRAFGINSMQTVSILTEVEEARRELLGAELWRDFSENFSEVEDLLKATVQA